MSASDIYDYFKLSEFDSADAPGSGEHHMDHIFVLRLDDARGIAGIPFTITSGYRTPEHNLKVGGSSTSSHLKGCAADIAFGSDADMIRITSSLARAGFRRIGLNYEKKFIHVDSDPDKPEAYFDY